jgi:hypothetical protein
LPGGQTLGQMDDVLYFQKRFYQCLNVPVNRLNSDALFSLGRATEVTRDEVKFSRFIVRLRGKFAQLFNKMLEKQCVLKKIVSIEDWNNIESDIKYDFAHDSYFSELKDAEIRDGRINQAILAQPLADKYFSHEWIRKNVLQQTEDDIKDEEKLIKKEVESGETRWINQELIANEQALDQLNTVEDPNADQEPEEDIGDKPDENNQDAEPKNIRPSDDAKEKQKIAQQQKEQGKKPSSFNLLLKKSKGGGKSSQLRKKTK